MTDFDNIIAKEKAREYHIDDQDQFVFDTLTSIQEQRSRSLKRALIILLTVIVAAALLIQVLFLQTVSFDGLIVQIKELLAQKPYHLALFNLGFLALIYGLKRLQIF